MATVTVTPTVEASTGPTDPPRVRLDVLDSGGPAITSVVVVRHDADGRTVPVRTTDGGPLGISPGGLIYDYEMPLGTSVAYSTEEDPATVSASVQVDDASAWLTHPGVPELSRAIALQSISERTRRTERAVFYPLGRARPVVHTDGQRKAPAYSITLLTYTLDELDDALALLDDSSVLLLNVPADKGWGFGAEYVSLGDVTERRASRYVGDPMRFIDLTLVVVDRPAGGTQAERTWADVMVDYATWADVMAAHPTWLSLLAGP